MPPPVRTPWTPPAGSDLLTSEGPWGAPDDADLLDSERPYDYVPPAGQRRYSPIPPRQAAPSEPSLMEMIRERDAQSERYWSQPSTIVGRTARDADVSLQKGLVGAGQALVGIADLVPFTKGYAGKLVEDAGVDFAGVQEHLNKRYSPETLDAQQAFAESEGFFGAVGAALSNPSVIFTTLGESAPAMLAGGGIGRGIQGAQ